jgi:hypothetical protein
LCSPNGILFSVDRKMSKYEPHPVAETVSQFLNHRMNRAATEVRIAAVLDERQFRIKRSQNVVAGRVDRRNKPVNFRLFHKILNFRWTRAAAARLRISLAIK